MFSETFNEIRFTPDAADTGRPASSHDTACLLYAVIVVLGQRTLLSHVAYNKSAQAQYMRV
jgi:hypothetical protein